MDKRQRTLHLPGWVRAIMGALGLVGILVSIAGAPQTVRDALEGFAFLKGPAPWSAVAVLAVVLVGLALVSGGPRSLPGEEQGRPTSLDATGELRQRIASLSDMNQVLHTENAGLKRRISELTPPENPVDWDDLTEDQKRALERMYAEGPVSTRHLDAETNFYEKHGFIERVAIINPGHTASFRLTEKSLSPVRARAR